MTMQDEPRRLKIDCLDEYRLSDDENMKAVADELDAILAEYADHVTIPQKPEDRRLDRLCFLPEAGLPTREAARVIYQVVAQE